MMPLAGMVCAFQAATPCLADEDHRTGKRIKYCDRCTDFALKVAAKCHAEFVPDLSALTPPASHAPSGGMDSTTLMHPLSSEQRLSSEIGYNEAQGFSASLRQQAEWIEEAREAKVPVYQRITIDDIDTEDMRAAADFIDRITALQNLAAEPVASDEACKLNYPNPAPEPVALEDDCSCGGGDFSGHDTGCPYAALPQAQPLSVAPDAAARRERIAIVIRDYGLEKLSASEALDAILAADKGRQG